jgi:hypothetical protein
MYKYRDKYYGVTFSVGIVCCSASTVCTVETSAASVINLRSADYRNLIPFACLNISGGKKLGLR